ncbi:hypothetical protein [Aliikangiella maris]|uniref:Uncharacterized protein n=2 Tax=Aliikangiella maris TaxID=3162458 RepID=A0ABV3MII8_9GAMM
MKAIISDSIKFNANEAISIENTNCMSALMSITRGYSSRNSSFEEQCNAVRFVFDEVEEFRPKAQGDSYILSEITKCDLFSKNSTPTSFENAVREISSDWIDPKAVNKVLNSMIPSIENNSSIVISPDAFINAHTIRQIDNYSQESILMLLASCGITLTLPSIQAFDTNELDAFKEKFAEERQNYLIYISKFVNEVARELESNKPNISDIYEQAQKSFSLDLKLKARHIDIAIEKAKKKSKKEVNTSLKEKAFSIGSALLQGNYLKIGEKLFDALVASHKKKKEIGASLSKYEEAAYIYQIKDKFS